MLRVEGLAVAYGDLQALWDVSFEVPEGAIVALLGANGAGKTTTLKAISRLLPIKAGSIELAGQRTERMKSHAVVPLGLAHVPEGRQLFPMMTVRENLELGAMVGTARKERDATLEQIFEMVPRLKEREQQLAGTLSGGEQQMVAIGRGLMLRPRLLMLDEPSLGLAPLVVKSIFDTIRRIKDEGVTILLVEQNVHHSLEVADLAYVLENGRVVLQGPARELANDDHVKMAYLGL
ncbi:MAG: ABC transporter ATP-binding protein [Chloroflexi bacterium]|nr:ABC transporter ATP-binding protein [Chloroflexota bacterium]